VVSFIHRTLYLGGKSPWCSLDRRLGVPRCRSGRSVEEKNIYHCRKSNPGRAASSLVTVLTELPRRTVHASRYGSNLAQGNSPEWNNMVVTLQQNSPRGKSRDINKQKNEAKR
jgi:hypothetical protein